MQTRRQEMIGRLIGIGFDSDRAVEIYESYIRHNRCADLEWYISLFENSEKEQRHSER